MREHGAHVRFIGSPRRAGGDARPGGRVPVRRGRGRAVRRELSLRDGEGAASSRSLDPCRVRSVRRAARTWWSASGGYASAPADPRRAPRAHARSCSHEPNAIPGLANRLLARWARPSRSPSRRRRPVARRRPRRDDRQPGPRRRSWTCPPIAPRSPRRLGRSRPRAGAARPSWCSAGARARCTSTGRGRALGHRSPIAATSSCSSPPARASRGRSSRGAAERPAPRACVVVPFLDRMELALAVADLVVARAGATTSRSWRSAACRRSSCRIPHATEHHQEANARELERVGARRCSCPTPTSRRTAFATTVLDAPRRPRAAGVDGRAGEPRGRSPTPPTVSRPSWRRPSAMTERARSSRVHAAAGKHPDARRAVPRRRAGRPPDRHRRRRHAEPRQAPARARHRACSGSDLKDSKGLAELRDLGADVDVGHDPTHAAATPTRSSSPARSATRNLELAAARRPRHPGVGAGRRRSPRSPAGTRASPSPARTARRPRPR